MRNGLIFKIKGIPAQLQVLISQGGNFFNPDDDASALAQKKIKKHLVVRKYSSYLCAPFRGERQKKEFIDRKEARK
jgi:hypothetical protein